MDIETTNPYRKRKIKSDSQTDDYLRLDHEPFDITNIEWGFIREIVVQNFSFHHLKYFPAVVKSLLQTIINNDDFFYYFYIQISTLIGISEKERFFFSAISNMGYSHDARKPPIICPK
ncbi:hypothetical protein Gotur_013086 [Gossypium turneri]